MAPAGSCDGDAPHPATASVKPMLLTLRVPDGGVSLPWGGFIIFSQSQPWAHASASCQTGGRRAERVSVPTEDGGHLEDEHHAPELPNPPSPSQNAAALEGTCRQTEASQAWGSGISSNTDEGSLSLQGKQLTSFVADDKTWTLKQNLDSWNYDSVPGVEDFSDEIDDDINTWGFIVLTVQWNCQYLEDLHCSGKQYFPDGQHMMLQRHVRAEGPSKGETD